MLFTNQLLRQTLSVYLIDYVDQISTALTYSYYYHHIFYDDRKKYA